MYPITATDIALILGLLLIISTLFHWKNRKLLDNYVDKAHNLYKETRDEADELARNLEECAQMGIENTLRHAQEASTVEISTLQRVNREGWLAAGGTLDGWLEHYYRCSLDAINQSILDFEGIIAKDGEVDGLTDVILSKLHESKATLEEKHIQACTAQ